MKLLSVVLLAGLRHRQLLRCPAWRPTAAAALISLHSFAVVAAEPRVTREGAPAEWMKIDDARSMADDVDPIHAITSAVVRERQLNPLRAARLFAGVRVAQSEALHALPEQDPQMVARVAAAKALTWLLPQEDSIRWMAPSVALVQRLGGLDPAIEARLDAAVAGALLHVGRDGADARRRPLQRPAPRPGLWMRTPPLFAEQPVEPQGAGWLPWCPGSDLVDVVPRVEHATPQWHEELRQVAEVTRRLTAEEKLIASRWHLDAGSVTPPGVWNALVIGYQSTLPGSPKLPPMHRALAVLNMAMRDALVASWRVKLRDWSERPVTAIQRELDPQFQPYLVTPPFPGYVSGHATVSAAAATVLAHFYPERSATWHALAREAAMSRLYGGIHFASDNEQGLALGRQVAQRCLSAFADDRAGEQPRLVNPVRETPAGFFVLPRIGERRD